MEHDIPVRIPRVLLLLALGCLGMPELHAMECPLLVVASATAPVDKLTRKTIRRLYLGVHYATPQGPLQPLRNMSDPLLQEVFLQKILFMSKNAYRRVLATRLVRLREPGPPEFRNIDRLIEALKSDPLRISYIGRDQLPADGSLKILSEVPCESD